MSFVAVGTSHRYSPSYIREKLAFSRNRLRETLNFLKENNVFKNMVIISTCNRTEFYTNAPDSLSAIKEIVELISTHSRLDREKALSYLYIYEDEEAILHLFSVASGLDSLILGETQILGQVRDSFLAAKDSGFTDRLIERIFYSAISCAKKVQSQTRISRGKVSVGSLALDFIREKEGTLAKKNILIIGVGKVSELVLKYLKKDKPNVVFVSNRTFEKAAELADRIHAKAVRFNELDLFLSKADVVVTATASPHFIIKKETLEKSFRHKLLILDLALPRDVDPRVKEIDGVELFSLEDLKTVIRRNAEKKAGEARKAASIIDLEVKRLWDALTNLGLEPVLLPLNRQRKSPGR